jgi:hypothetical protein
VSECISHSMALQCVDNLLDHMGHTKLDFPATRKILNAVRVQRVHKNKQALQTISQNKCQLLTRI